jgi:serine/threonine protein kinase
LKPENVLIKYIDKDRVIYKLTDFGFAKSCALSATIAKSYVGTPQYVAPEIIENDSHDSAVRYYVAIITIINFV